MKKHDKDTMNYDENGYYSGESDNSGENGIGAVFSKVMGVILLIWFIVSMILMIVIANSEREEKAWLIVVLFFQIFAVFGLFGIISDLITKSRLQKSLFLPLIIGAGGCFISFAIHNSQGDEREHLLKMLAAAFPLLFAAIGVFSLYSSLKARLHTKKVCTELITAKCVDKAVFSTTINGRTTYKFAPTYEYEYGDKEYTSTAFKTPEDRIIGDDYEILVNPDKPKEIYDPTSVDAGVGGMVATAIFLIALPLALSGLAAYFLLIDP